MDCRGSGDEKQDQKGIVEEKRTELSDDGSEGRRWGCSRKFA